MPLRYAYNTNGCANHRLADALDLIAVAGYDGVALTLDWHHLDPLAPDWRARCDELRGRLGRLGLASVIETGARFLLDPRRKHEPTLVSASPDGRARRVAFLKRAVDIQVALGAETVSCWAGVRGAGVGADEARGYLREGLAEVLDHAAAVGGEVSLEPEPGMAVETNADYRALVGALGARGDGLRLALDLGHVWVTGETFPGVGATDLAPAAAVHRFADRLGAVAIEGMDRGVHVHRPLDAGDMPIPPLLAALRDVGYRRLVSVELSRESPRAHEAIPASLAHLRRAEAAPAPPRAAYPPIPLPPSPPCVSSSSPAATSPP